MLYKVICAATIGISSISVLTQLILLPWLHQHTANLKTEFESRLRKFHHNARQFDEQLHRLGKLTGGGVAPLLRTEIDENVAKMKRQIPTDCPPPRIGSPGEIGEAGEDGEPGDAGEDGAAGLDAMTLLMQEAQKCVICPQGPAGPIGAPGLQGFNGPNGDKGEVGEAGTDGLDGEQGPEGLPGLPGIAGKAGKKGPNGSSAPGGTGPPGPPGVKGPPGPTGKQGERGRRNFVIGMPGLDGRSGKQGLDGLEGKPGARGDKGPTGEDGADARFCPCPSELNKLGNGEKPHSHLMPPLPQMNPTKASSAPAPAQAPSSSKSAEEERKSSAAAQSEQEKKQIGDGLVAPIKQPTSAAITNNGTSENSETATNLRITHLRPGEQPTIGKEAATQNNKDYEDAYPNYESGGNEDGTKGGGKGKGKSGEKPSLYDDEIQLNVGNGQQQEEVKPAKNEGNEEIGEEDEGQGDEENHQQEGGAPIATRKFVYVTKKPRPKL